MSVVEHRCSQELSTRGIETRRSERANADCLIGRSAIQNFVGDGTLLSVPSLRPIVIDIGREEKR